MESFDPYDLVLVPFPFTDRKTRKRRPAVVLSKPGYQQDCGQLICAMVTTAQRSRWSSDVELADWKSAGLPQASKVRMKLFSLDARIVLRKLGTLEEEDRRAIRSALQQVLD